MAIGQPPNYKRRNGHGEQVHEQVVEAQGGRVSSGWNQIVDGGGQGAMIPAQEKRPQTEEQQEMNFFAGIKRKINCWSCQNKTDRDDGGSSPSAQSCQKVRQVCAGCDTEHPTQNDRQTQGHAGLRRAEPLLLDQIGTPDNI